MLDAIENALRDNKIKSTFGGAGNHIKAIADFKVIEQFFESLSTNFFNSFLFFFQLEFGSWNKLSFASNSFWLKRIKLDRSDTYFSSRNNYNSK